MLEIAVSVDKVGTGSTFRVKSFPTKTRILLPNICYNKQAYQCKYLKCLIMLLCLNHVDCFVTFCEFADSSLQTLFY